MDPKEVDGIKIIPAEPNWFLYFYDEDNNMVSRWPIIAWEVGTSMTSDGVGTSYATPIPVAAEEGCGSSQLPTNSIFVAKCAYIQDILEAINHRFPKAQVTKFIADGFTLGERDRIEYP